MRALDTLDAVRALLHHAARAHGHVGIVRGLARRVEAAVVVPVEASYLVGTVARAGAGADAAVVDLLVESFGIVHGRINRAGHFARRLLAMHARHGLKKAARVFHLTAVVAIDAKPQHLTADRDLVSADDE